MDPNDKLVFNKTCVTCFFGNFLIEYTFWNNIFGAKSPDWPLPKKKKKVFLLSCYAILPKLIGSIYQTIKINLYYLQNKIYMIVVGVWINDGSKNWYLGGWTRSDLKTTQSSQCGSKKRWLDMPGTIRSVHHRDIKAD